MSSQASPSQMRSMSPAFMTPTSPLSMAMGVLEDGAELARIPTAKMHAGVQVNPHATAYVRLKEPGPWAEIHGMADVVMEDIFDHVTRMVVPRFLRYF